MDCKNSKVGQLLLLADDDPVMRGLLEQYVTRAGYEHDIVSCGKEALCHFRSAHEAGRRFTLIVLDASMPDCDGFEVGRAIREIDPDVPIIYLTAIDDPQSHFEAERVGAFDYLTKPEGVTQLVQTIEKALTQVSGTDG
jgi:DNA-binding response OmpR family regulator